MHICPIEIMLFLTMADSMKYYIIFAIEQLKEILI